MRYVFSFGFALALGLALMAGCSDENGEGGSGGTAGIGGMAGVGGMGGEGGTGGIDLCVDMDCDDLRPCTSDTCDPVDGTCVHTSNTGNPCSSESGFGICVPGGDCAPISCEGLEDGSLCFYYNTLETGICIDGVCIGHCEIDADCNNSNACTVDVCDQVEHVCEHTPVEDGISCRESAVCVAGQCRDLECEVASDCNDFKDCTAEQCVGFGFCAESIPVPDGTPCAGGECSAGDCSLSSAVLPCTDQGIRNAIAAGGGPYTFDCDGPTTVVTEATIHIDNDVILDGGGKLTVEGNGNGTVFDIYPDDVVVEVRGFTVTGGTLSGIVNDGTLALIDTTVSGNTTTLMFAGGGITNEPGSPLTLINSTVSGNSGKCTGGILSNGGFLTLVNSTVSGNGGGCDWGTGGIHTAIGFLVLLNSTVEGIRHEGRVGEGSIIRNSVVGGAACALEEDFPSGGHNIESPGNTCGFDQETDQVNVTAEQLNLGPLQDNGGPTMTHALGTGSVAIDVIPGADCVDAEGAPLTTDQRGEPRPETGGSMCDVGAFEVQP